MINKKKILTLILTCVVVLCSAYLKEQGIDIDSLNLDNPELVSNEIVTDGTLTVQYIDVGQGDCEFITFPDGRTMLIDAGTTDAERTLPEYLESMGVKKLDYVIGTHPHEDHIGGLDAVIENFEIGQLYMPKATATTKTYKDVLSAVKKKGLTITTAKAGKTIINEPDIKATLLAPVSDEYEEINDYSAVLKLQFGSTSFLFTGDAEKLSESEMLNSSAKLKSTVLKVGHHGSSTSTSDKFLKAVSPEYAIISCATGNDYGHPHRETVQILNKYNIKTYRTDQNGTITAVSDGNSISFATER